MIYDDEDAEYLTRHTRDADTQLGAGELEDGPFGPRRLAAELARQAPEPCVLEHLGVDGELGQPLTDPGILPRGAPIDGHLPGQLHEACDLRRVAARARGMTLVHQRGRRHLPALVD